MSRLTGSLSESSVLAVVRDVHRRRLTGVLEIDAEDQRRRLHFLDGELYLPGAHPLARRLAQEVESVRTSPTASDAAATASRRRLLQLVERIAGVIVEWRSGEYRFESGSDPDRSGLVGPLPTRRLLMLGETLGLSEEDLLGRLGGEEARLIAGSDPEGPGDLLGISPEERFLLERLRGPMPVRQVLAEAPESRLQTMTRLVQLQSLRLVRPASSAGPPRSGGFEARELDGILIERLSERIRARLEEEPIELSEAEHREMVGDLLARFGGLDYYELLGIRPDAPDGEVQAAYERIARRVHPSHAARLGLAGRDAALRLLFETVTTAYRTLSDSESRRRYNERQLIDLSPEVDAEARREETRGVARAHYDRGQAYSSAGDVHSAIQLFEQASRLDPRAEYLSALARHLARNPNWRERAVETYRAALELDPNSAEIRYEMGTVLEELGDASRARVSYSAALSSDPSHAAARSRLEKLLASGNAPSEEESKGGRGLFSRLFGKR